MFDCVTIVSAGFCSVLAVVYRLWASVWAARSWRPHSMHYWSGIFHSHYTFLFLSYCTFWYGGGNCFILFFKFLYFSAAELLFIVICMTEEMFVIYISIALSFILSYDFGCIAFIFLFLCFVYGVGLINFSNLNNFSIWSTFLAIRKNMVRRVQEKHQMEWILSPKMMQRRDRRLT